MVLVMLAASAGCLRSTSFHDCAQDADDGSCESGRKYLPSAGELAGVCLAPSPPITP